MSSAVEEALYKTVLLARFITGLAKQILYGLVDFTAVRPSANLPQG